MTDDLLAAMDRVKLPLDGSIAEQAPAILRAFAALLPRAQWSSLTYVDLTAGSCLLPLLFGAAGVARLVVNDTADRSRLAAQALFGGRRLDPGRVRELIATAEPRLRPHVPTFHFACDYFTAPVADVFDRLFHADLPEAERPAYQYLALLWALGFAASDEEGFRILMTQDEEQLLSLPDADWRPYVERARNPEPILLAIADALNTAIDRQCARAVEIHQADMLELCERLDWGEPTLVTINPPTRGLDEYVIDDQVVHSLIANRLMPLSMSRETPEEFWTRRLRKAMAALPTGAYCLVYGGDGSLGWEECMAVWRDYGKPAHVERLGKSSAAPGWAIFRRG